LPALSQVGHASRSGWTNGDLRHIFMDISIFLGNDASVLHWRGDTFDLPAAASRLASNATYDNQAFSYGEHVLALQFHMEVEPRRLDQWYIGHTVELVAANVSVIDRLAPPD